MILTILHPIFALLTQWEGRRKIQNYLKTKLLLWNWTSIFYQISRKCYKARINHCLKGFSTSPLSLNWLQHQPKICKFTFSYSSAGFVKWLHNKILLSLVSSLDMFSAIRFSSSQTLLSGFESAQSLCLDPVQWSCAVVINSIMDLLPLQNLYKNLQEISTSF